MDPCQPQKGWTLALVRTLWFSVRKSERTPAGQLLGARETGSETMKALSRLARFAAISAAAGILAFGLVQSVQAEDKELVIAYHADLPSWDPSLNFPEGQAIFKTVFDAPLMQERSLKIIPHVISGWEYVGGDPLTLRLTFRDDVTFHNGDKLTAEDFKFSFQERVASETLDFGGIWSGYIKDIEIVSPTEAIVHFNAPMPTALEWWAFLGSYILPKKYYTEVGRDEFLRNPVGSGPYKFVDYQRGSRIVLEAYDGYWGGAPAIKRVTYEILSDAPARVAAVQSGRADVATNIPIREALRLDGEEGLTGKAFPVTRVFYLQIANKNEMNNADIRAAMHHAIDKKAISERLYSGKTPALALTVPQYSPGHVEDFWFPYDPDKAIELLAKHGYGPDNPVSFQFMTSNGAFANDFEMARAIAGMWKRVGIDAPPEVIELSKYYELNNTESQPEVFLYSWDNSTGDPEIFTGYMFHGDFPFGSWREEKITAWLRDLFTMADYDKRIQQYKELNVHVSEESKAIPLVQSAMSVAHKDDVMFEPFPQGWVMPYFMDRM